MQQKKKIRKTEWNNLIILDACRWDYFAEIYRNYLTGKLEKATSPSNNTAEWLKEVFGDWNFEKTVYVSANPFINSKGIEIVNGFNGSCHFDEIVDVWDWGWDSEAKTVPPDQVSKAARLAKAKFPSKRLVAHFIQPHEPYLTLNFDGQGFSKSVARLNEREKLTRKIKSLIRKTATRILGKEKARMIEGFFAPKTNTVAAVAKKYGKKGLRTAYRENLKVALKEVHKLVKYLPGKSIVTSDHGELLGEGGLYGHSYSREITILKVVPWLLVSDE